ncbi:MAG TPA: hypothetical protein VK110_07525 [Salinisphaeraceae bacterium]|nr:hypothetical protein [Salinisphaeraceae bacterium]
MAVAISLHILGVVWWIGGLAFVSTILLPELRRDPESALPRFRAFEHRFAPQVRIALLLVGGSGGWLLYRLGLWRVLDSPRLWWLHAMIALWTLFMLMLFVLGPSGVLKRIMSGSLDSNIASRLARMHYLHVALLIIALIIIAGAVIGNHGYA